MKTQTVELGTELRLSPKPVLLLLVALSFGLLLALESFLHETQIQGLVWLEITLFVFCALIWWIDSSRPNLARHLALLVTAGVVLYGYVGLGMGAFATLLPLLPALAIAMTSVACALAVAASETVLVMVFQRLALAPDSGVGNVVIVILSIWALLALLTRLFEHLTQVDRWAQDYLKLAHDLIREQRDRRAELAQTMDDLVDANRQLTQMNVLAHGLRRAAEEARLAKERFVANVSHELRTPLNMITGFSRMILEMPQTYGDLIPPTLLADLSVVYRNAEHLSSLIDDVLDLSQIDARHMAITKEQVHLPDLVEAAVVATRPLFRSKKLYVRVDIEEALPPVLCDRTRILEVLLNLLSNAGRFTDQGGVTVRMWQEQDNLMVSVADTGPGIAKSEEHKVFVPFQQLDDTIRRRHGGTGLGLSISKSFVELHGGRMWFESQPQTGTTFFFQLPTDSAPAAERDPMSWFGPYLQYEERTRPSLAGAPVLRPRVVVLDPAGSLQRLLNRYLEGYDVASVTDLAQAAGDVAARPTAALLINDLSASGSLEQLNAVTLPYGTPVIACSTAGALDSTGSLGVNDYLVKPVSREAMLASLDKLDLAGGTILIVDDEPEALRLFRRMLVSSNKDYRVLRAEDGREALRVLRERSVDAILLDLVMPHVDGFQLLEAKQADPMLRDIPVIIISARDPAGQPIVSNGLSVKREGGLTAPDLLACIRAISRVLSPLELAADPEPAIGQPG